MLDVVIKNANIIDGTGAPAYTGDVGIKNGKFTFATTGVAAKQVISAEGLCLCPGFIDMHSHGDMVLGQDYARLSKVSQGITTEIGGHCGLSMFPIDAEKLETYKALFSAATAYFPPEMREFITFDRFLEYARSQPLSANIAAFAGHGAIRLAVMGLENRQPTTAELDRMKSILADCMESGALGMSTGLIYSPGVYAKSEEIVELAKVVEKYGGMYASHLRNESFDVVKSVAEAIDIGRQSGAKVLISHHKVCGKRNWGLSEKTLELADAAVREGIQVTIDQYPYTAAMTSLNACIPPWYFTAGIPAMAESLKDPSVREKLKREIEDPATPFENFMLNSGGFDGVFISSCPVTHNAEGMFVSEYAAAVGRSPFDAFCDLMIANGGVGSALYHCMSEDDLCRIIQNPNTVVGTDGASLAMEEKAHPRSFGTFVRAICYYHKEKRLLALEEIIRKMTSLPAERAMLVGKGVIAEGYDADLVLFNYDELQDTPSYKESNRLCKGIVSVFVNGKIVYNYGGLTGETPGRVLLRGAGSFD